MQVPLNTTVAQGDQLGFFIGEATASATSGMAAPNLVPYCHLEYNTGAANGSATGTQGQFAFQQGAGQNSLRGLQMNLSPVAVREGKGIKFFSTVV